MLQTKIEILWLSILIIGSPWLYFLTERSQGFLQYTALLSYIFLGIVCRLCVSRSIRWAPIDLILTGIFIFQLLWCHDNIDAKRILAELCWYPVYMMCRLILEDKDFSFKFLIISRIFMISCILQFLVASLQQLRLIPVNHIIFNFTGAFFNPGPLAGYLAIGIVLSYGVLKNGYESTQRFNLLYWIVLIVLSGGLCMARSRAAILAVCIGLVCYLVMRTPEIKSYMILGALTSCLIIVMYLAYPPSADARFLIWKVSLGIVGKSPIFGHGTGAYASQYMWAQSDYFNREGCSLDEQIIAADNIFPFNELVRMACEYGIIGLVFLIIAFVQIAILIRRRKNRAKHRSVILSIFLTLFCFSMFSYPIDVMPIMVISSILLSIAVPEGKRQLRLQNRLRFLIVFVCLSIPSCAISYCYLLNQYRTDCKSALCQWNPILDKQLESTFKYYRHDLQTVDQYAASLYLRGLYEEALPYEEYSVKIIPSGHKIMSLGECYWMAGDTLNAEKQFKIASNMLPAYIRPRYLLFQLYNELGRTADATIIATNIVHMIVKKESPETDMMIKTCERYLHEYRIYNTSPISE